MSTRDKQNSAGVGKPIKRKDIHVAVAEYLRPIKDQLISLYPWNPDLTSLYSLGVLSTAEERELKAEANSFKRELKLKEILCNKLREFERGNKDRFYDLALWIIRDWGGITAGSKENTKVLIEQFLKKEIGYNRIASVSKVAAFMYPERMIIYDSRVAYSLNWILLKKNVDTMFFPIPEGRNSKMMAFDMNVIIRQCNKDLYTPKNIEDLDSKRYISELDKSLFIDKKIAYKELNELIRKVNDELWEERDQKDKLYYTEMLLFSIADRNIFKDITESIITQING